MRICWLHQVAHLNRTEVRRHGSWCLFVTALELKESRRARHCEQGAQLVHSARTASEHGPVKKRKSQNLATPGRLGTTVGITAQDGFLLRPPFPCLVSSVSRMSALQQHPLGVIISDLQRFA